MATLQEVRASCITLGEGGPVKYESVYRDSYKRLVSSSADRKAFKENSLYLRGHHFAFGTAKGFGDDDGPPTASKDAYRDPGKAYYENFVKESGAKAEQKAAVQKASFTLGCDTDPNHYKSIHTLEICDPAKIPRERDAAKNKPQLRGHNFILGSDRNDYTSTAGAAHVHFKDVDRGPDLKERTRALRQSSFVFGNDAPDYESAAALAYTPRGFGDAPKDGSTEGDPKGQVRGVNFKSGNTQMDYRSEAGRSYSQVEELNAHCRNPTRLDASTKKDLRSHHFEFGSDEPAYQSLGRDSYGAKARDQEEVLKEMNSLSHIKKDLRATHITLGAGGGKFEGVTASRAAYVEHTAAQLAQAHKDKEACTADTKGVHFTLGVDNEELKRIRSITLSKDSMQQGVCGVDYAKKRSAEDMESKADLRKCHFYLGIGQGADQWQSTAGADYVEHKDAERTTMSAEAKKDLRASHYQLGGEEGYPKDMKSTAQEQYCYFGPGATAAAKDERSNVSNIPIGFSSIEYHSNYSQAYTWPAGHKKKAST